MVDALRLEETIWLLTSLFSSICVRRDDKTRYEVVYISTRMFGPVSHDFLNGSTR
jgi:hypothetical protein